MKFDISAELDEMARKRNEEFVAKQAAKRQEEAARKLRRKHGKAKHHALRLARKD